MNSPRDLRSVVFFMAAIWTIGLAWPSQLLASAECENWMAKIVSAQGSVQSRRAGETLWTDVQMDDLLCPGDMLRVQENSRAALLLSNEAIVRLDQNTAVTLSEDKKKERLNLNILSGIALILSGFPFNLQILTPFVNANIEGTEFLVQVGKAETTLIVYKGTVRAENELGGVVIHQGESAYARAGAAPVLKTILRPRDAVQWALYYPPIPGRDLESLTRGAAPWRQAVSGSIESYRRGDLAGAFAHLKGIPSEIDDPAFHAYLAMLHLTVGRVDEASQQLERAILLRPDDGYALSLQSIIALAQNRKEEALSLARAAVERSPSSAAPLVALSYVQQARFDLDGALSSLERAAEAEPEDGLVRARLAELWLSQGYLDRALQAAQEAVARNPELARTQTVLGYVYLTQIRIDESKQAFRKAIRLDQADPLPRLGLGLAIIRDGELQAGRTEIEIAVMLDPNNSLIRSYLGKAYFEEKRDGKSAAELSKAKELDPHDPTPWLYDAIRKQTINRPVEALEDLQKSISLNDNRAVYRSRLLLDEDLAVRSVSLARIYRDLGFEQLALAEGWKSLSIDPTNFSAHRLLSDSYANLPRHEIARVSELLQAQLLQPININPLQPRMRVSELNFEGGLAHAAPSLNEYTSLFNRNRIAFIVSGAAGENELVSEEVVHSGVYNRFSYSLGQFHHQDDGFRENNDIRQDILDFFTQFSLTPKTSLQAEYRRLKLERGDLEVIFDQDNFRPQSRLERKTDFVRFGVHHEINPAMDILGSFNYAKQDDRRFSSSSSFTDADANTFGMEGQYLYNSEAFAVIAGLGYFEAKFKRGLISNIDTEWTVPHKNFYIYSQISYPKYFTWTIGASGDFMTDPFDGLDAHQLNPKFGVMWTPFTGTTLRAAAFRILKRTLINDQTLEPTQVSGFNQFFDDPNGADVWCYGLGLDQKISANLSAGAEISKRDLDAVGTILTTRQNVGAELEEYHGRAYVYWTPHKWVGLGSEYEFERFKYPPSLLFNSAAELNTHRIKLGASVFHPSGFYFRLSPSLVMQDGRFESLEIGANGLPLEQAGDSNFFVLDALIGYRLPDRWGIVSIEARNLFDKSFHFQDSDIAHPRFVPDRVIMGRFTLSF